MRLFRLGSFAMVSVIGAPSVTVSHSLAAGVQQQNAIVTYSTPANSAVIHVGKQNSGIIMRGCDFLSIAALIIQDSGNIVAVDSGTLQFCIYSPSGRLIRRFGRAGAGPGEYRGILSVALMRGDSLLAYDHLLRRFTVLSPDGTFARSFKLTGAGVAKSISRFDALRDGTFVVAYDELVQATPRKTPMVVTASLLRHSAEGAVVGQLGRFHSSDRFVQAVPPRFGGVAYWRLAFGRTLSLSAVNDGFITSTGTNPDVRQHTHTGKLIAVHRLPVKQRAVTPKDIRDYAQRIRSSTPQRRRALIDIMLAEMPYPKTHPPITRMLSDGEHRVWLETSGTHPRNTSSLLLDVQSRRLTAIVTPTGFEPKALSKSRVCGVRRDELDVEEVVCYAIT